MHPPDGWYILEERHRLAEIRRRGHAGRNRRHRVRRRLASAVAAFRSHPGLSDDDPGPEAAIRRVVVDHVDLFVEDLDASLHFYQEALSPLGIGLMDRTPTSASLGADGSDEFGINAAESTTSRAHVAFLAPEQAAVDRFYEVALRVGGRPVCPPGIRPDYHPGYYAAYVLDPDGNNIEAVHHGRQKRTHD